MITKKLLIPLTILLLLSLGMSSASAATPDVEPAEPHESGTSDRILLIADPSAPEYHVPAPAVITGSLVESTTFNVNYLANTTNSAGDWCTPWPDQAKTAFSAGTSIWASMIQSSVPIEIEACWTNLGSSSILGYSLHPDHFANFPGAPQGNTGYPAALANALSNVDRNGSEPEMYLAFNTNFPWYFGTDGNTPNNQYDLETVVLHEVGHGLGFAGAAYQSGAIYWESPPFSFDRFTENGSGIPMLNFASGSGELAAQMTSGNVYFDGPNANAANGGNRVKLYAPGSWQPGSSYSHLDEVFNSTPNALMTYSLGDGVSIHNPGPVTRGLMADIGWNNTPPTISGLPYQLVQLNGSANPAIDLWAYANDPETPDSGLTFNITNSPASSAGVSLGGSSGRYVNIQPSSGWTGETEVTIQVSDPGGETDSDTFQVTVGRIWNGDSNNDWHTSGNWSPSGVPSISELVVIPPAEDHPIISSNTTVVKLIVQPGGELELNGGSLRVEDELENHGTLRQILQVNNAQTSQFLRITNQAGNTTKYYGLDITPSSVAGSTSVTVSVSGNQYCSPQVPGVKRCYDIDLDGDMTATVRFYFTESEQNGLSLLTIKAYHYGVGGWAKESGVHMYSIGSPNYVDVSSIDEFSPFALSDVFNEYVYYLPMTSKGY